MEVKEEDLFKYVFYPKHLKSELKFYILQNIGRFKDFIELLENTEHAFKNEIPKGILNKIYKLIKV